MSCSVGRAKKIKLILAFFILVSQAPRGNIVFVDLDIFEL
jgi:hypothetical protein